MGEERAEAMSRPGGQTKVFISYSRKDAAFADRVWDALKERGFLAAIDHDEIFSLEKWWDRLKTLMLQADTVVFVVSPNSIASKVALNEVEFASSMNKRFAPIIWRRVEEDSKVPEKIREYNFIFFDDESQFPSSMDRLVEALNTDIDWLRLHTEYGQAARKWSNEKRPRGLLLRSPSLERAEKWVKSRPSLAPPPTAETHEFIARSRADARARVVRIAVAGIAAVFLSGLAIVYTQYTLDNEAYAEAREINADLGIQPEQALSNRQRNALWRLASASKTVRQKLVSIILDGDDQTVRNFAGLSFIMRALGPLADADQEKFVNAAIAAIQRNRDPQALLALSTGLAAIPVTLTDDRARRALEPILKRIKELWVDNRELIVPLAHAVGALAPKLPPAEAQQALKAVVDEIAPEEPRFDGNNGAMLDALAAALKAIPGELTSERAQKALHPTIELSVLRALAPKLPSSLAQQAAQPLIQKLRNSQNPSQLWDLLRTIGALNVKLDDEQRGWVLDTILPQMAQTTDLESLASVLATIGEGLNAPQAEDVCKTLLEKADVARVSVS
jgi:hypothetical protein